MSRFVRRKAPEPEKVYDKPWEDPNFDSLRHDKKRIPLPTEEEHFIAGQKQAQAMLKRFGWRRWMGDFIDREGNNKSYKSYKSYQKEEETCE